MRLGDRNVPTIEKFLESHPTSEPGAAFLKVGDACMDAPQPWKDAGGCGLCSPQSGR